MTLDTAVIPCGGRGTRLHPITRWLPKEILPGGSPADPATGRSTKPPTPASSAPSSSPTPTSRCSRPPRATTRGRSSSSSCPRTIRAGSGDALLRARDQLAGSPFLTLLPDNLFQRPQPERGRGSPRFRATGLATVLLAEITREDAAAKGPTGRAAIRARATDGTLRVTEVADKGTGRFDTAGEAAAVTPIGRMAFPGGILEEFEEVGRGLPPGVELDDVPVLQRLARAGALAGVISQARFFDVGVPEGYRDAVTAFPLRA